MRYIRQDNDKAYRKVKVNGTNTVLPPFQDFSAPEQIIDYQEVDVIEIKSADGSCHVEMHPERQTVTYTQALGGRGFSLPGDCPVSRLWVRSSDGTGIWYKVPNQLKHENGRQLVFIPGGIANIELCGDVYFDAVFELQRR